MGMGPETLREWAIEHDLHPQVLRFLLVFGSLHASGMVYADAAGWQTVSALIDDATLDPGARLVALEAVIGVAAAAHLTEWLTADSQLDVHGILTGAGLDGGLATPHAAGLLGLVVQSLSDRLRLLRQSWLSDWRQSDAYLNWLDQADHAMRWTQAALPPEYVISLLVQLGRIDDRAVVLTDLLGRPAFSDARRLAHVVAEDCLSDIAHGRVEPRDGGERLGEVL